MQRRSAESTPCYLIFLIDQSRSMGERFGHGEYSQSKAQGVATALNRLLQNLVLSCTKTTGVRDYFYVSVIGYGYPVEPLLHGPLTGQELVPISALADHPLRIERRMHRLGSEEQAEVSFPVWVEPKAYGWTHMREALLWADRLVAGWVADHPHGYPPIVFNLTDGGATDGNPVPIGNAIMARATADGHVLSFNLYLSSRSSRIVLFPASTVGLPEQNAQRLFAISSVLPEHFVNELRQEGFPLTPGARRFVYNADLTVVIQVFDLGTRTRYSQLR